MNARLERGALAAQAFQRHGERHVARLQDAARILDGEHGQRQRNGGAVDEAGRVLGGEIEGRRKPGRRQRLAGGHAPALPEHLGLLEAADGARHVRQRRKVARCADRSLLRNDRRDAGVEAVDQPVEHFHARAGIIGREGVGAQQHRGARDVLGERLADAGGVRVHRFRLVLDHVLHQDALVLEQADAGVERIHQRRFVVHEIGVEPGAGRHHAFARALVERDLREGAGGVAAADAGHIGAREARAVDDDSHDSAPTVSRKSSSTANAAAISACDANSSGRWLTPPRQRTKTMACGMRPRNAMASCPAPLGRRNTG